MAQKPRLRRSTPPGKGIRGDREGEFRALAPRAPVARATRAGAGDRPVSAERPAHGAAPHAAGSPAIAGRGYRTVAGMVAVITAVLAGSTAALAAILIFDHSLAAAVISGTVVALPALIAMIRYQDSAWERAAAEPLRPGEA